MVSFLLFLWIIASSALYIAGAQNTIERNPSSTIMKVTATFLIGFATFIFSPFSSFIFLILFGYLFVLKGEYILGIRNFEDNPSKAESLFTWGVYGYLIGYLLFGLAFFIKLGIPNENLFFLSIPFLVGTLGVKKFFEEKWFTSIALGGYLTQMVLLGIVGVVAVQTVNLAPIERVGIFTFAFSFIISDIIIGVNAFLKPLKHGGEWPIMITYALGHIALASSIILPNYISS